MKNLLIIAHPDDELVWFSSILFRDQPDVICVTNGRDEADKKYRINSFSTVMKMLGIEEFYFLDFPDTKDRLDLPSLEEALSPFVQKGYDRIYTHGPFGEIFNHAHHQDINYITHKLFDNVYSVAWNIFPDITNQLSVEEYDLKKYLLGTVYQNEYAELYDAYRITSSDEFVKLDPKSVEIYYWAIGNFGDNHEFLGKKYDDFWGFKDSPYELERHAAILSLAQKTTAKKVLELGACEGVLTDQLSEMAEVDCTEKAGEYKKILSEKGYKVVEEPSTSDYDLSVIASFLEYLDKPEDFLKKMNSKYLIVDVILDSKLDRRIDNILNQYEKIDDIIIDGRWERMFHNGQKAKLPVYKLGSHCKLYQNKRIA